MASSVEIALKAGDTWCSVSIIPLSQVVSSDETHTECTESEMTVSKILCRSSLGSVSSRRGVHWHTSDTPARDGKGGPVPSSCPESDAKGGGIFVAAIIMCTGEAYCL